MINFAMLDIEALGKAPDGKIVSIAVVMRDPKDVTAYDSFYNKCNLNKGLNTGRTIDVKTVQWWLEQSDDVRREAMYDVEAPWLEDVLVKLTEYFEKHNPQAVWANGVTYDMTILRHAYSQANIKCPWTYKQESCMRSLRKMEPYLPNTFKRWKERKGSLVNAHNALADAIAQYEYVEEFIEVLKKKG